VNPSRTPLRRAAALLLDRCKAGSPIRITHQEIAAELGSSREVISRILEDFAAQGAIRAGRGVVEVVNSDTLRARAEV